MSKSMLHTCNTKKSVFHVLRYLEDKTVRKASFSSLKNLLFKTSLHEGTGPLSSWGRKKIAHLLMGHLFPSLYKPEFKPIKVWHWYGPSELPASYSCPSHVIVPSINWLHKESNSSQLWIRCKANMKDRTKQEKVFWQFDSISCPTAAPHKCYHQCEGNEMQRA